MARVQYGAIVTDLKGTVGGQVFQGGNASKVLRNKGYSKGTASQARTVATQLISLNSTRWRTLDDASRALWNTAALTWAFTDKFGNVYYGSGYQVFIAFNAGLSVIGATLVTVPHVPVSPVAFTGLLCVADDTSVMDLSVDAVSGQNQHICVYMTQPSTAGKSYNNLKYRFIGSYQMDASSVFDLNSDYNDVFGGRVDDNVIYGYVEVRVDNYPRATLRTYFTCVVT